MLERIKELSETVERILRLRTPPIGITLLKDVKGIPDDAHKPDRATVCQVTGIARYHGIAVGGEKGKVTCPMGATALGFSEWPEGFFETRLGEYSDDINAIKKMMRGTPQIKPHSFSAILAAPVSKLAAMPDLISIYANSAQVLLLAYGVSWKAGDTLVCETTGHMGECSNTIAATHIRHKPCLALPCYGARRRGLCTDSEMIVGIPSAQFEEIAQAVIRTHECGRSYPIKVHGLIGHYSPHWPAVIDYLDDLKR
jgi:uncharacterized protein (DUF169 family)